MSNKDLGQKFFASIIAALIFLLVSSQFMYNLTNKIGLKTLNYSDHPTTWGYILHSIVFGLIVFGTMFIPKY